MFHRVLNGSLKFCNIHGKTPVLESLYYKETPTQVFFCEYCKMFKNTYFEKHLQMATSANWLLFLKNGLELEIILTKPRKYLFI